jgi:hypothetical protein
MARRFIHRLNQFVLVRKLYYNLLLKFELYECRLKIVVGMYFKNKFTLP